jgi:hypothetical protein
MGDVVPFRHPDAPLSAKAREAALHIYREGAEVAARKAIRTAFGVSFRECGARPGCEKLGVDDVVPVLVAALHAELNSLER